jgi:hypothetical protein
MESREPDLKNRIGSLYTCLAKRLGIKQAPALTLSHDEKNAEKPFGFTANYDHENKKVKVYITKRHPTDILRSFAHEIIHHWQNEHGRLEGHQPEHYAQTNPKLRKAEMEAYLLGNIIFRDWQDENRYGDVQDEPVSLNENIAITDPTKLRDVMKQMIRTLIVNKIITSYHRQATSGDMNSDDFVEDFAHGLSSELERQIETINNRGNWENQSAMVK